MSDVFPTSVPTSLSRDGWWLSASSTTDKSLESPRKTIGTNFDWRGLGQRGWFWLLPLIILADWLFWGYGAGISLSLFAVAIVCAAIVVRWRAATPSECFKALAVSLVSVLPSVLATGFFSVMFLILGTMAASLMLHNRLTTRFAQNVKTFVHFTLCGPFWIIIDTFAVRKALSADLPMKRFLNGWALPAGLGLIFLSLFVQANPVFEGVFTVFFNFQWLPDVNVGRVLFWLGLLILLWPYLNMASGATHPKIENHIERKTPSWLAQDTIRNALLVFNVMFAAQTLLDLTYLWSGVSLPDGMSYAEYAHRGAYPLLATALLAGIFMLCATIFEPLGSGNRRLLYVWIAQNAALVLSSVIRLELYVAFYSLTYLRVAAFIWMGLVAVGLVLIAVRISQDRANGWVLKRIASVATIVLYICCFVNFASLIANYNVTHSKEISGTGLPLDRLYLCNLGPEAYPAADRFFAQTNLTVDGFHAPGNKPGWLFERFLHQNQNWREWGFRDALLSSYLHQTYPNGVKAHAGYSYR